MRSRLALSEVPEEEPVERLGEGAAEEFGVGDGLFVGAAEEDDVAQARGLRTHAHGRGEGRVKPPREERGRGGFES